MKSSAFSFLAGMLFLLGSAAAAPAHHHHVRHHHRVRHHAAPKPAVTEQKPPNLNALIPDRLKRYALNTISRRKFRAGSYLRPTGWFYHRWAYGEQLPRPFYVSRYWIAEYTQLGLTVPPGGYVWVRVDSDALMINMDSGIVLQAVYNIFS